MSEYLTTQQVAARLGVTIGRIQAMIRDGRLPAKKFGQVWMILEEDLKRVENRKPGRPRTK